MNIVNVGYDSANYYILADTSPRLLIDVGWPGTLPRLQHQCQRAGVAFSQIKHFLITHYHPDHAGLAQELKRAGVKLVVIETQVDAIPLLRNTMKPEHHYQEIDLIDNVLLAPAASRAFLARLSIQGEIVPTPGHSDDSVTLVLDEGAAFTGDLTHPNAAWDNAAVYQSWDRLRALGVRRVYPGHGPVWTLAGQEA
jgi:glyoxylase-like metal-dependent hydrolase (beta-lactamase superfamily II)